MSQPTLEGTKVQLVPHVDDLSLDGYGFQAELYGKNENMEFLKPILGKSAEFLRDRKKHPGHLFWIFYDKASGQRAGWTGFNKVEQIANNDGASEERTEEANPATLCNFGIVLDHSFWGRGLASEAMQLMLRHGFEQLNAAIVELETHPENKAMRALCARFDMTHVRTIEKEWEGVLVASCYYTLTRADWEKLASEKK